MRLRFLGHAAFDLALCGVRVCLDPHRPAALGGRLNLPPIVGPFDVLTYSHRHDDHCGWTAALGTTRVVDRPSTVGAVGFDFRAAFHDSDGGARMGMVRMTAISGGGHRVVHCGDLGAWDGADLAWLCGASVLLVPAGGTYTLDGAQAAQLASEVGAHVTVPMHCADPRVDLPLAAVDGFLAAWPGPVVRAAEIGDDGWPALPSGAAVVLAPP